MTGPARLILVVDDERLIRDSLEMYLADQGYDVVTAGSGEEGLAALAGGAADLAVVDIRLPGMSGQEFILKAHALFPGLKFLVFTGSAGFHLGSDLRHLGITDREIFFKPLADLGILLEGVRRALA